MGLKRQKPGDVVVSIPEIPETIVKHHIPIVPVVSEEPKIPKSPPKPKEPMVSLAEFRVLENRLLDQQTMIAQIQHQLAQIQQTPQTPSPDPRYLAVLRDAFVRLDISNRTRYDRAKAVGMLNALDTLANYFKDLGETQ